MARIGNLSAAAEYRGVRVLARRADRAGVRRRLPRGRHRAGGARRGRPRAGGGRAARRPAPRSSARRADAPADRTLVAYASGDGVRQVLAPRDGLLGALGALLDRPGARRRGRGADRRGGRAARARAARRRGAQPDAAFEPVLRGARARRTPPPTSGCAARRGSCGCVERLGAGDAVAALRRIVAARDGCRRRRRPARAALRRGRARGDRRRRGHRRQRARRHAQGAHRRRGAHARARWRGCRSRSRAGSRCRAPSRRSSPSRSAGWRRSRCA